MAKILNYKYYSTWLFLEFLFIKCICDAAAEDFNYDKYTPIEEADRNFWYSKAQDEILKRLYNENIWNRAKNIILFLGDGMPLSSITAARIYKGQLQGYNGEEDLLSFEKFPFTALSKTYCTNAQVADSACSATAYLCGVKSSFLTLGVTPNVRHYNCEDSNNPANHIRSIASWAQKASKTTGIVTTARITDASPAGNYANTACRFWESDTDIMKFSPNVNTTDCMDIAQQLIKNKAGINFDVIMGGGMGKFLPNHIYDAHGKLGERSDGQNLLDLWKREHRYGAIVTNRKELFNVSKKRSIKQIFGLFASSNMDYQYMADVEKQPSLADMTEASIEILSRNRLGYFLFVEGGLIDKANHINKAGLSLIEILEFDKAIERAINMTNPLDTLIVVTTDHGHPITISGYAPRGNHILGINEKSTTNAGYKYTTLNYAVGSNQYRDNNGKYINLENLPIDIDFVYPSLHPYNYGTHSGEDVAIFANGPYAHLFNGVMEQNTIPHLMAYAACIGDGITACSTFP